MSKLALGKPFCEAELNWLGHIKPRPTPSPPASPAPLRKHYESHETWDRHAEFVSVAAGDFVVDKKIVAETSLAPLLAGSNCVSLGAPGIMNSLVNPAGGYKDGKNPWGANISMWGALLGQFSTSEYNVDFLNYPTQHKAAAHNYAKTGLNKTVEWWRMKPADQRPLDEAKIAAGSPVILEPAISSRLYGYRSAGYKGTEEGYRLIFPEGRPISTKSYLTIKGVEVANGRYVARGYREVSSTSQPTHTVKEHIWTQVLTATPGGNLNIENPAVILSSRGAVPNVRFYPGADPNLFTPMEEVYRLMYAEGSMPEGESFQVATPNTDYRVVSFKGGGKPYTYGVLRSASSGRLALSRNKLYDGQTDSNPCSSSEEGSCVIHITKIEKIIIEVKRENYYYSTYSDSSREAFFVQLPSGARYQGKLPFRVGKKNHTYSITEVSGAQLLNDSGQPLRSLTSNADGIIHLPQPQNENDFSFIWMERDA